MIILIDGNNFLHRILKLPVFFGMNNNGFPTGGIYGFLQTLSTSLNKTYRANKKFVIWDGKKSQRRMKLYPEYKSNRKPKTELDIKMSEEYFTNFNLQKDILMNQALPYLGCMSVCFPTKEADDVTYQLAKYYSKIEDEVLILSEDSDLLQIINEFPNVKVYRPIKESLITKDNFKDELGIEKELFLIRKAISGDKSDYIKGIEGIGEVTAQKIAENLNSQDPIISLLEYSKKPLTGREKKIKDGWGIISRNLELMELKREEFLDSELEALKIAINAFTPTIYRNNFRQICNTFSFESILRDFDYWMHTFEK